MCRGNFNHRNNETIQQIKIGQSTIRIDTYVMAFLIMPAQQHGINAHYFILQLTTKC